ncbi:hypothetical protein JRJ22_11740 [Paenibacillus tianjinensis]|uniref:5-bromo-4-chloroindolyl phosphate hydrolysis protein n=1 Tax=Paenibacillus tianjinensis TaxID=2810347 RepID=A0ABX7LI16_9BACL|nr:hypothetical protein JRJ22_11740 [Paenibacillus tianjinensis]
MNRSGSVKLLAVIAGIVILNIAVLSPGLLDVEIGGERAQETASGVTLLFISLLVVLYGSYTLLFKAPASKSARPLTSPDDYAALLQQYKNVKVLKNDVLLALDQLERMEKKRITLTRVLSERFDPLELSYRKFSSVIAEVEKLLYLNVRGILNKLSLFDASEFSLFANTRKPPPFSEKLIQQKTALYNDFFTSLKGYLGANEKILLKLDQLLLEISELDSMSYERIEEMPCMQELSALINQTKLYQ